MSRWRKSGVWDRVFARLQQAGLVLVELKVVSLDSTSATVHPDGTGAEKKTVRRRSENREEAGTPRFIWLPRMMSAPSASASHQAKTAMDPKAAN
jgi:hypothetical protein